ncbi:hypothetical protein CRE_28299 [Caenorhabditis remanei]|uniref:Uncharacterized protein n=1 Tax=Caenorhabditis remanei TaxID=31234 RepID=E3LN80_CAERE|nr:hypothetical protein CRE_28299 [Caenorhabditis remanei]
MIFSLFVALSVAGILIGGHKPDYRKLKGIERTGVFKADVEYYRDKSDVFAVITCKPNPVSNYPTWIMVKTGELQNPKIENGVVGLIPLSGGINITYAAKYDGDGEYRGRDFLEYKLRKFKHVGCYFGTDST